MMKKILVPTDFSENAYRALLYACKLAQKNGYALHLYHCYTSQTALFEVERNNENTNIPLLKADVLMLDLKESIEKKYQGLTIETTCTRGLLTEKILAIAVEPQHSLIVMGTTGTGTGKSVLWGSNASFISSKAKIPVIAVPENEKEFALTKVAILTNFKAEELDTLKAYVSLVGPIPELDIIHVFKDKIDQQELESWAHTVQQLADIESVGTIAKRLQPENEALDSVAEVLNYTINENNYHVIIVTKSRRSFFNRLFNSSVSKQLTLNLERPTFFDNN
ncbi:universal stress protein [Sphingobacterium sp. Mn56C]|uniref:universal stress protein n=1 Tax=Sphingobacterium sp. Mn56C TaxID=3395261 RepID=UPI003BD28EF8